MKQISSFAPIAKGRLYFEIAGEGDPLILIHAFSFDMHMWDDQFLPLSENFQVIRYDLRGFGRSSNPQIASYSHAKDLQQLMDYLNIRIAHVIGLSRGGRVAVDFALTFQERINKLILANCLPPGFPRQQEQAAKLNTLREIASKSGIQAAITEWLNNPIFDRMRSKPSAYEHMDKIIKRYSGWHWLNCDPEFEENPYAVNEIGRIKVPVLVISGDKDVQDFKNGTVFLSQNIPNAKYAIISGAGHMTNMEMPNVFNGIVLGFLKE